MVIQNKKSKEVFTLHYQQYKIGLYVVLYKEGRLFDQFGYNDTPKKLLAILKRDFYLLQGYTVKSNTTKQVYNITFKIDDYKNITALWQKDGKFFDNIPIQNTQENYLKYLEKNYTFIT